MLTSRRPPRSHAYDFPIYACEWGCLGSTGPGDDTLTVRRPLRPSAVLANFGEKAYSISRMSSRNEIIFVVEDAPEGGFTARALGTSIVTEADTEDQLQDMVQDAVDCHFDDGAERPKVIRLHFVRERVIAVA